jgi:predicted metal-binding protein
MSEPTSQRISKIDPARASASLRADAERYADMVLELGATDARVIAASSIPVDERVSLKCAIPKCFGYGTCANCPPYSPSAEQMRAIVGRYAVAIVIRLENPPEVLVRDRSTIAERVAAYKRMFSLVSALESAAFYDGHYLSVGLAAGSCKSTFCHDVDCAVLAQQKCRHNLISRPSMEAVG